MGIQELTQYFTQYGAIFVFVIVLLEYMNLPGFPAGIIMPMAGVWASRGQIGFLTVMALSVAAGLLGSWILYFLGRLGGDAFFRFYIKKFPKQKELLEKNIDFHSGRDDFYEFHQVYHQFPDGSGAVESDIYRGRIFPGRFRLEPSGLGNNKILAIRKEGRKIWIWRKRER